MNKLFELLFRVRATGTEEIDKVASATTKVKQEAEKLPASFEKATDAVKKLGDTEPKVGKLADTIGTKAVDAMGALGIATEGTSSRLLGLAGGAAAVVTGIGLIADASFNLVRAQGAAAESTINLSDRIGAQIGRVEQLEAAAKIAGVQIGALEGASRTLSLALEDSTGAGAKAAAGLRDIGVSTRTTAGELRNTGEVILDVLDKLSQIGSDSERVFKSLQVLPRGAAIELQPLIKNYDELRETVKRLGVGLDEDLTRRLAQADDEIGKVEVAWDRLKKVMAGGILAKIVISGAEGLTNILSPSGPGDGGRGAAINPETPEERAKRLAGFAGTVAGRLIDPQTAAATRFRAALANTTAGRQARAGELQRIVADLTGALSEPIDLEARSTKQAELSKAQSELSRLNAILNPARKQTAARQQELSGAGADLSRLGGLFSRPVADPRLFSNIDELGLQAFGSLLPVNPQQRQSTATEPGSLVGASIDAQFQALLKREQITRSIAGIEASAAARQLELSGRELEAAKLLRDYKISTAADAAEARAAELDYTNRILELERQRSEKYRDVAGRVFDAGIAGGRGGLAQLARNQVDQTLRQVTVNASAGIFEKLGPTFGKIGEASGLGSLLKGTIFDPANASSPLDKNTTSVERLRRSVDGLTATIGGGVATGGFAGLPGLPGIISDANGITGQGSGRLAGLSANLGNFGRGAQSATGSGFFASLRGVDTSIQTGDGQATTLSSQGLAGKIGNTTASAAIAIGAIIGVKAGLQEGGARGGLSAAGAALGAAAAITPEPISKAILMSLALGSQLIKGILGDPKENFRKEQESLLKSRAYEAPQAIERFLDLPTGAPVSYDASGQPRTVNLNFNVQAMDARSFIENRSLISQALMADMRTNPQLRIAISNTVFDS